MQSGMEQEEKKQGRSRSGSKRSMMSRRRRTGAVHAWYALHYLFTLASIMLGEGFMLLSSHLMKEKEQKTRSLSKCRHIGSIGSRNKCVRKSKSRRK